MSNEKKVQFYLSDKPIDAANIIGKPMEYPTETSEKEREHKNISFSFDCKMSKEVYDWVQEEVEKLRKKENRILESYLSIAKENATYYQPLLNSLACESSKQELLESIIMQALCKGWNDCFEYNVKRNNELKL